MIIYNYNHNHNDNNYNINININMKLNMIMRVRLRDKNQQFILLTNKFKYIEKLLSIVHDKFNLNQKLQIILKNDDKKTETDQLQDEGNKLNRKLVTA